MARLTSEEHIGMTNKNFFGTEMRIVDYINGQKVLIEFQDEYKYQKYIDMSNFRKGVAANPYDKTVLNIGCIGDGAYSKEKNRECYVRWHNILVRCFDLKYKEKYPTYKDVCVVNEWLNFQNFAKWYYDNVYSIPNERMEIDKDILFKNNKIYSPDKCIFVPRRINSLLINNKSIRGKYPVGVDMHRNKFRARCNTLNGNIFIGHYNTVESAFKAYKKFKENYIKEVADEYKEKIPDILYQALYRFEIEVND